MLPGLAQAAQVRDGDQRDRRRTRSRSRKSYAAGITDWIWAIAAAVDTATVMT